MNKKTIYAIVGLVVLAAISVALYFILGSKKEYTITFDTDGGSSVSSQTVVEGEKVVKPSDPTKDKFTFVHWEYQNKEYNFYSEVTSDMTLKAIWKEKEEEKLFDIEFVVDGVTKKLNLAKITEKDLESLGFPEKEGYEIKWYVNDKEYDFNEPLTENVTLTGKYVKLTVYTVKFTSEGGITVPSQKVKPNEKATEPEAPTRYGFIFDGWYLNNKKYDFSTPVTGNITLTAKWSEDANVKRYTVTFDSDGGSKVNSQRVIENEKATEPKAPTRTDYKFLGWYLGETKYDFKTKVTKDITLKAKWEEIIKFTVTFDKANGTTNDTVQVISGEKVAKPKDPTKDGHRFTGWIYNNREYDFNTPVTTDMTLTARYAQLARYTVTFDSNGGSAVASQQVYEGGKATEPTKPTKADHDFVEWRLNGTKFVFNTTTITGDITLVAEWKATPANYTITIANVDTYSPARRITVFKNGTQITVRAIKAGSDGAQLCGSNTVVDASELEHETSLIIVLNDGKEVRVNVG